MMYYTIGFCLAGMFVGLFILHSWPLTVFSTIICIALGAFSSN